tara:strand:+ start:186 stop:446 length:261 start_codon:yes stop_codon:yes gene_type:complete
LSRQHDGSVATTTDRGFHPNGQVQVTAGDRELVTDELQVETGQNRKAATASRHGAPGYRERPVEYISLASKLHRLVSFNIVRIQIR